MACRFPGSNGISDFWRQLVAGENAVIEGPPGSVIGRAGRLFPESGAQHDALRFGAFIEDLDQFDAEFFRISPIEAQMLDPQQRMMLETTWHALEDAAIDPESLRGSRTGVYVGISNNDYRDMVLDLPETAESTAGFYAVTGTALNTAIGRVSFALGLQGPSMAIDTACSSSLVAIHQAVGGLQRQEADLALAGGVHVFLIGRPLELRANAGMLSPTGQCWTFDAAADGFACGEGCGLVVLKRLSEAEADGDRIWAVIRGSSVNQDGASQGLTVPSGPAQERAMEEALARAGVSPAETDYLESHGTGTIVGDPIELNAAASVYGRERSEEAPLLIGSVKTNIGHLGPAAGAAGLIKTVLAMRSGVIPRHLNFSNPTPSVDWDRLPLRVTDTMTDWPLHPGRPPVAGINSFGWSGTNAHVVVGGYGTPDTADTNGAPARISAPSGAAVPVTPALQPGERSGVRRTRFLPLSGKSRQALRDSASQYLSWLDEHAGELSLESGAAGPTLSDAAWTAAVGRSHFTHRAGIVFNDVAQLRHGLEGLAAAKDTDGSPARSAATRVAFVFTGQASQWPGMGEALYETEPAFRAVLDRCDRVLSTEREVALTDVMFGRDGTDGLLDDPSWTQPAIYALECALVALWESVGVRPSVVLGHSLGEIAAAQAAGVFTVEEGLRYAAARGTLMGTTRRDGAMAAVFAPADRVAAAVAEHNDASTDTDLSMAADNGLQQVVSGPAGSLEALLERFESSDVKVVRLRRSPAYHSALIDPALDDLEAAFNRAVPDPRPPSVPLVNNLSGRVLDGDQPMDAVYWRRQAREPVAFRRGVETLAEMGVDAVAEVGPHAVLGPLVSMIWPGSAPGGPPAVLQSLERPSSRAEAPAADTSGGFVSALAAAYEAGLDLEFAGLFSGEARRRVSVPGYPFQRVHHWIPPSRRRRLTAGHPLLGDRRESPRGEVTFESEISSDDPAWVRDHLVYGRVVVAGGLYGAMAVSAGLVEQNSPAVVEDMQLHNALMFDDADPDNGTDGAEVRRVQLVLDGASDGPERRLEIYSRNETDQGWTLHAAGRLGTGAVDPAELAPVDLDGLRSGLEPQDPAAFYRMRSAKEIYLGPSYHTLRSVWAAPGEAVSELVLQESLNATGMEMHPLLLDGCFQVLSLARHLTGTEHGAVYMPFGWERLWVAGPLTGRMVCHAVMRELASPADPALPPEVVTGDVRFYSDDGTPLGALIGFTVKRATRSALLSAREGLRDLLYEVQWREQPSAGVGRAAGSLAAPAAIVGTARQLADHLADEGVGTAARAALLEGLERLSQQYAVSALDRLGWERVAGAEASPEELRLKLAVVDDQRRLFDRLLEMLAGAGLLDPLPNGSVADPEALAARLAREHPSGVHEIGLLCRCGAALADVLQGRVDPLSLLFGTEEPRAVDLYYLEAPASRAANRMLGEAVAAAVSGLPEGGRLRVLEIGAGTASTTAAVLPALPPQGFDYTFTDISAGFFIQAEPRLADSSAPIEYKSLDIERDPASQGFNLHGYDLVIAANVLHATRDLSSTLAHCRDLLAPSGQLIALEVLKPRAWQDLTFGLLDGWWRFDDAYRSDHALAAPAVWRRALADAGFSEVEFLGSSAPDTEDSLGSSVILARGPDAPVMPDGVWVLTTDDGGTAAALAAELAARAQTVVLAGAEAGPALADLASGVTASTIDLERRESWRDLFESLPAEVPLRGVVHLMALDGHGAEAGVEEMATDVTRVGASALALVQGMIDAGAAPTGGAWFVTRGAQVLEQDLVTRTSGELAGATLWGFGKVMALEEAHLRPRMLDLDPGPGQVSVAELVDEILFCDPDTHVAYRGGSRHAARLVRSAVAGARLTLPEDPEWVIGPEDPEAGLETLRTKPHPGRTLEPGEVRVAVDAVGLNFADVLRSIGAVPYDREIGLEMCGRVVEAVPDVEGLSVGDPVVGMGFGGFTPETVTQACMVAPAPGGLAAPALATVPVCFVTAELAFELAGLEAGQRVLVHAGAGGVGLAAVQLARAAGAEVFATASAGKRAYLRSIGVDHVYDSRSTAFGDDILDATGGEGVDVVLNSLTGEDFIEASLSCLASGGCFVELGKRGIWSSEEMSASRPDVAYSILDVDSLKRTDPAVPGASLSRVVARLAATELAPLPHTVWPLAEIRSAMEVMRAARHIGKNVLRMPPLARDGLRPDRTYLVTGGMGGIGCEVARWLADNGAGTVVLNGRRAPDPEAEEMIRQLREGGVDVRVEVADVTDPAAVEGMLARVDETLPPLGGVFHSVGVLSDGVIENQTWDRFELVLWPKVLGAWQLHLATRTRDLDMFVLFSSVVGVVGNSGQANHAAANAFLDQLAAHRRSLGLPGQAIAWGAWSGVGEAEEQRARVEKRLAYTGSGWITPQQGIKALDWLVRHDVTASAVTSVDWSVAASELETPPPFLEEVLATHEERDLPVPQSAPASSLLAELREAPAAERQNLLASFIQQELKAVMRLASPPSPTTSFFDLGMDSLMAVELRNRINRAFAGEQTASNTVVFDYPTAAGLAGYLSKEFGALTGSTPTVERSPRPSRPRTGQQNEEIAIVGMACRFPGAPDIDAFWTQLAEGRSGVTEARQDPGSWEGVVGDPDEADSLFRRGAFIEGIDRFDSGFFRILPIEARAMDPQQRMLLETSWHALEDAGIDPDGLRGSRTGVYVGVGVSEYRDLLASRGQYYSYAGTNEAVTVSRVAFALGLEGPALSLDMACASALAAVHQAVAGLQRDEVDLALSGGVNAILSPRVSEFLKDMGMLSSRGRCSAFDEAADGFVRGEGCGILVLKRLSDAEADGDRIWGVVLGSAVNQNGESASLMAPNGPAQERVMEEALARAGVAPADVEYLEAHGVGSEFGDPIEINAVASVYGHERDAGRPLLVGSVKTNIGHLEWASGAASVIKTVLAMRRGVIPRNLHFRVPNPLLDWDRLPVRVAAAATDWPSSTERPPLAAVNSFAISGTNAHVVVGGYRSPEAGNGSTWPSGPARMVEAGSQEPGSPASVEGLEDRTTRVLPLSGKSPDALRALARRYSEWLSSTDGDSSPESAAAGSVADLTWTAGVGRSHLPYRAGLAFSEVSQLREMLSGLAESEADHEPPEATRVAFVYTGGSDQSLETARQLYGTEPVAREVLDRCAETLEREQGTILLDLLLGRGGEAGDADDPGLGRAAACAVELALTELWKGVGVQPSVVVGSGLGKVAAAQAAGVLGLEDAVRLAAAHGLDDAAPGGLLASLTLSSPSVTVVDGETGQVAGPGKDLDAAYWTPQSSGLPESPGPAGALFELGVDALIEMVPASAGGFAEAVARAYEAGLDIAFNGLYAGEERRRVAAPSYPFQRRRHWADPPKRPSE